MGEVGDRVGDFVTAYSADLRDESLDGQRIVVGGIVVGSRTVITRARATMAVVTLEDLQGTIEVVVFPKLYEQTLGTWQDGAILLVAGRIDHRGEEVSLLADLVTPWDDAVAKGPEAFARDVAAGDRGSFRRRQPGGDGNRGNGAATSGPSGGGSTGGWAERGGGGAGPAVASASRAPHGASSESSGTVARAPASASAMASSREVARNGRPATASSASGEPAPQAARPGMRPGVPYVSPLREMAAFAGDGLPAIAPAEPVPTYLPGDPGDRDTDRDDEPSLPDEVRARVALAAERSTVPLEVVEPGRTLHVRFGGASAQRLILAMETFRELVRERPGDTRVVVHVPGPGGAALPMELRSLVAYDAELLAEVHRRLGDGLVDLRLA